MTDANDEYSKNEAQHRFEQALRGSREVGPKFMKDVPPKRGKKQCGTKKKARGV